MAQMRRRVAAAVVVGILFVVVAVAAAVAKQPTAPVWMLAITGVLLAVFPPLIILVQAASKRRETDQHDVLRETAGAGTTGLVRDTSPLDVRVHAAVREDVGYVARDLEQEVVEKIRVDRRVLIVGPSMSGKTRMALTAARVAAREYTFYEPNDGKSLHEQLAKAQQFENTLIWLDDLERFLGGGGLTAADLTTLRCCPTVRIVATIRTSEYDKLTPSDDIKPPGWDALAWFRYPTWLLDWSEDELARLSATRIGSQVLDEARRYGLSQYLGGAPLVVNELKIGPIVHPDGFAVLQAIVDWRRAGIGRPMPRAQLERVYSFYVALRHARPLTTRLDDALEWALRPLNHTVALVTDEETGYRALDLVMDQLPDSSPPPELWSTVLEYATDQELTGVAYSAYEHGETTFAHKAWEKAATAGHTDAMFNLGVLLTELSPPDLVEARTWYEKAATAGHTSTMFNLGLLLKNLDPST